MYVCEYVKVYRNHVMSLLSRVAVVGVKLTTIGKSGLMMLSLFRLKSRDGSKRVLVVHWPDFSLVWRNIVMSAPQTSNSARNRSGF